jgi:hypothetical protein
MLQSSKKITVALALCVALIASGCGLQAGGGGGVGEILGRLRPLTENCDGPINSYDGIDMSASARGDSTLKAARLAALSGAADQTAACGGTIKVVAFSSSAPETFTLGEGELPTEFGTQTARLLKANEKVDDLMAEVEDNFVAGAKELNSHGTDVLAQLTLAKQYQEQSGEGTLHVLLETDGIATTKPFDAGTAREAAESVPVPDLSGATVNIVGVGKATGARQLSTEKATAIVAFFTKVCERSGADCLVTNDYTSGG